MMTTVTQLEKIIALAVEGLGFELVNCTVDYLGRKEVLRVYVEHPSLGVTVDDCGKISRQVSAALDVALPLKGQYTLEISSPGLDRALTKPEHYCRFVGSEVRIRLRHDLNGRRNFTGKLLDMTDDRIQIQADDICHDLPLSDIEKANLVPDVRFKS